MKAAGLMAVEETLNGVFGLTAIRQVPNEGLD